MSAAPKRKPKPAPLERVTVMVRHRLVSFEVGEQLQVVLDDQVRALIISGVLVRVR